MHMQFNKRIKSIFHKFQNKKCSNHYETIKNKIHKHDIKTVTMGFPDLYGRFVGKKFNSEYFLNKILKSGSAACNYLLSNDLTCTPLPNARLASYERGFGDFIMMPDISSMRDTDYVNQKRELLFVADLQENDQSNVEHAPRSLLKRSLTILHDLGYKLVVEGDIATTFFNQKYKKISKDFGKLSAITDHNNSFNSLYSQINDDFLNKIKTASKMSQIHINSILGNDSHGQFSFSFDHSDPITYSDNISIFKLITKKLAEDNDMTSSFMSKISMNKQGNAANLKISIIDIKTNRNVLSDLSSETLNQVNLSTNIIGGLYSVLNDLFVFYNPTVNSYKRLRENQFNHWSKNFFKPSLSKDFVGITIVRENCENKLLFNLTGSDLNPYLSLFALTSSFIEGIQNKTDLSAAVDSVNTKKLPLNLQYSVSNFEKSEFAKRLLGDEIHYHFSHFYNFEYTEYMNQVDEWERNRYFYSI